MAGSHVWVTRFSIVRSHPESGYVYQRYTSTGFRCCNPEARYPYTPSAAATRGICVTGYRRGFDRLTRLTKLPRYCRVDRN